MASRLWEDVSRGVSPWLVGPPRASYDGLQLPDALSQAPTPFRVEPRPAEPGVPAPRPPPAAPGVPAPRPRPAEPGIPAPRRRVLPEGRVNQPEPEQDLDTPPPPPVIARVRTTLRLESAQPRRQVCRARYAAVDLAGTGLIDLGRDAYGARLLLAHRRGGVQVCAGDSLRLRDAPPVPVLWTTRHRYYSPGAKVTTLVVAVPDAAWSAANPLGD